MKPFTVRVLLVSVVSCLLIPVAPASRLAHAGCNIVPPAVREFRSVAANVDRPFARPGDWVTLTVDEPCHDVPPPFVAGPEDLVVSVVFTPPNGQSTVVAIATDCRAVDTASCGPAVTTTCLEANPPDEPVDLEKLSDRVLRFRFPDTDGLLLDAADDLTLTGPATIAVTAAGAGLPCGPCSGAPELLACVDRLFDEDGNCGVAPHPIFGHFTALPPPNDYQALCTEPASVCRGDAKDVRMAIDAGGNLLVPLDWRGVILTGTCVGGSNDGKLCAGGLQCQGGACRGGGIPVARLLRGSSPLEAFPGRHAPILIPDLAVLGSYSPEGVRLPPLFDPQHDPTADGATTLFGSADAAETVLRVARRGATPVAQCGGGSAVGLPCVCADAAADAPPCAAVECPGAVCEPARCARGANPDAVCATDADCPGGECGPGLFDFATRMVAGRGPVLLRRSACVGGSNALAGCSDDTACPGGVCGAFEMSALDPVALDGLNQTEALNAFVSEEAITGRDLNGDGDAVDHVVSLASRVTGVETPIGVGSCDADGVTRRCPGRAVARIHEPPFSYPAVTVDGDLLAYLEPEPLQGDCRVLANCDQNGDRDVADTLLKIFRLDGRELTDPDRPLAVDAAPLVNHRSVAVSDGRVFFRAGEWMQARRVTELASDHDTVALAPQLSLDGTKVGFASTSSPGVLDLASGLISHAPSGAGAFLALSGDGSWIAFDAAGLPPAAADSSVRHIYVAALADGRPAIATVSTEGVLADASSDMNFMGLSADGNVVAYSSRATNLVNDDTNGRLDVFVHAFSDGKTERVRIGGQQGQGDSASYVWGLSADGRYVLVEGAGLYVSDWRAGLTTRVGVDSFGNPANFGVSWAAMSADGRVVAFVSGASNLVPGDTNGTNDVFVHDRQTGQTTRVSVDSVGRQSHPEHGIFSVALSPDGRFVAFDSPGSDLVADGTPVCESLCSDVFVHDRLTGVTRRESVTTDGLQDGPGATSAGLAAGLAISDGGRVVAFTRTSPNLVPGETDLPGVYLRRPDDGDRARDLTRDGDLADTVLQVLDVGTGNIKTLCPADQVAVAGGMAAFLRPEAAGPAVHCPTLSGTGARSIVQLFDGERVRNLGKAATAVALSTSTLAAAVVEDGDAEPRVEVMHPLPDGAFSEPLGTAVGEPVVVGDDVLFRTLDPSGAGGAEHALHIYRAASGISTTISGPGQDVQDFVAGPSGLVAFRTRDQSQDHDVLRIYDLAGDGPPVDTGQAVIPCPLEACDPRLPYQVADDTVRFLTLESQQPCAGGRDCLDGKRDLNGDGDTSDLVLQLFNVRQACQEADHAGACHVLAATAAGVCTTTGTACARREECCGAGETCSCFLPPGGCLRASAPPNACDPMRQDCPVGAFCQPTLGRPGAGTCFVDEGACQNDGDCRAPATCNAEARDLQRVVNPLTKRDDGSVVVVGSGQCVEHFAGTSCASSDDCRHRRGASCADGTCQRTYGSCTTTAECPPGSECDTRSLLTQTLADSDGDELPDAFDNCPRVKNVAQLDSDGDHVGDACEDAVVCEPLLDPSARVAVDVRHGAGRLTATVTIPASAYQGGPVLVRLADGDGPIAAEELPTIPARSHGRWRFQRSGGGLVRVDLGARGPGALRVRVRATHWFTAVAAAADQTDSLTLAIAVGGQCWRQPVTRRRS